MGDNFKKSVFSFFFALSFFVGASSSFAERLNEDVAFRAWKVIASVERENGIPLGLLHSMSLVETGKGVNGKMLPWPYTVRLNSSVKRESRDSLMAVNNLIDLMKLGYRSFDVTIDGRYQVDGDGNMVVLVTYGEWQQELTLGNCG